MPVRTSTPAESWHDCGTHRVRVTRRIVKRRRRYLAAIFGDQAFMGRTVIGDYPSRAEALKAARLFLECTEADDGARVCNWRDVERVRAELRREAR